ncbi:uncharacterized protein VTP21DRAFT_4018 [Calcarisporiella thermophila]|uniref:uncharacterized protein n=1 Tax=Calcarisporiella thermophila TaxID=911321 RepID=UPI0037420083
MEYGGVSNGADGDIPRHNCSEASGVATAKWEQSPENPRAPSSGFRQSAQRSFLPSMSPEYLGGSYSQPVPKASSISTGIYSPDLPNHSFQPLQDIEIGFAPFPPDCLSHPQPISSTISTMHSIGLGLKSRRAAQNRAAQRAFRQRKDRYVKDLEEKVRELDTLQLAFQEKCRENEQLYDMVRELQAEIAQLSGAGDHEMARSASTFRTIPTCVTPTPSILTHTATESSQDFIDPSDGLSSAFNQLKDTKLLAPHTDLSLSKSSLSSSYSLPGSFDSISPLTNHCQPSFDREMLESLRVKFSRCPLSSFFEPVDAGYIRDESDSKASTMEGTSVSIEETIEPLEVNEEVEKVMDNFCEMLRARPPPELLND